MRYKIETREKTYFIEADNKKDCRKKVLSIEGIEIEKHEEKSTLGRWINLLQHDEDWKDKKIGQSNLTIGSWGCLITSLSMLSYWYGDWKTPDEISKNCKFTSNGLYIWKSGDEYLPFKFVYRYYKRDLEKIKQILFSKDNACVVQVPFGNYYHWLPVVGYDQSSGLICADPLSGKYVSVEKVYGKVLGFGEVTRK